MRNTWLQRIGMLWMMLILLFLYLPIIVMAAMSFNSSPYYQLPFEFSLTWYKELSENSEITTAAIRSVLIAIATAIVATILGTAAAIAFFRYEFKGKKILQVFLFPPIAIPWLITGTAMLIFFFGIGLGRGTPSVLIGHISLAIPYVIIVVLARLSRMDKNLEDAARSLGASSWVVTRRVTIPWILPGIIAGALFAFAISFDQFVVSYFLAEPGDSTLPVLIYTSIRKGFTPEINAISTIIITVSMSVMLLVSRITDFKGHR